MGEGSTASTNPGWSVRNTGGLSGSQSIKLDVFDAGLRSEGMGISIDDWTFLDVRGLESSYSHHFQTWT